MYKYKVILWPEFWVPHCVILFLPSRNDIKPSNLGLPYDYSFKTSKMLEEEKDYQQLPVLAALATAADTKFEV